MGSQGGLMLALAPRMQIYARNPAQGQRGGEETVKLASSLELFSKLNRIFVKLKLYSLNNKSHSPCLQTLATIILSVSEFDPLGILYEWNHAIFVLL